MELTIVAVFILGYVVIAFEHKLKINKTATALITGVICWTFFILASPSDTLLSGENFKVFAETLKLDIGESAFSDLSSLAVYRNFVTHELSHHVVTIAGILFFLLSAMTIVELIDAHHGFRFITDRIRTKNPVKLLWVICWITFFLSAVLDNLTGTIVMVSLVRKLVSDKQMRLFFVGMIVIAANAGGAWTPMGDVTTTMLWIGGQISTMNIIKTLFLPSVVCLLLPLLYLTFTMRGSLSKDHRAATKTPAETISGGKRMLFIGIGILLAVPVFKVFTHLPPFVGMLLGLGILWVISELIHPDLDEAVRKKYTAAGALSRIDVPSILFFLGILLATGVLESMLTLQKFSEYLEDTFGDQRIIIALIGILSAIVDNVPLVAAAMGMYSLDVYPMDHFIWEYLAYCAGTGGSLLIIGSAAGVAAMGMEKIDFLWYVKKISWLALIGYVGGAFVYLASRQ